MGSLPASRVIDIMDEYLLEYGFETTSDEMMHDSITKVRGKYLSLYRITDDECCTCLESICTTLDLIPECDTLPLIVELELECTDGIAFVCSTVIVRSEDVGEGKHDNPEKKGFFHR